MSFVSPKTCGKNVRSKGADTIKSESQKTNSPEGRELDAHAPRCIRPCGRPRGLGHARASTGLAPRLPRGCRGVHYLSPSLVLLAIELFSPLRWA